MNYYTAMNLRKPPDDEERKKRTLLVKLLSVLHQQSTNRIIPIVYMTNIHNYLKHCGDDMDINLIKQQITQMTIDLEMENKELCVDKSSSGVQLH
jgi:hypothetical protein